MTSCHESIYTFHYIFDESKFIMRYKASLDNIAKIVTIIISLLFLAIIISNVYFFKDANPLTHLSINILLILIYIFCLVYSPRAYSINNDSIIIHRYIGGVDINKEDVKSIEMIDKDQLRGTIRTFGVGGLFGYFGKFWNKKIGKLAMYATRMDRVILITTNFDTKIIITPDEVEKFIAHFQGGSNLNQ